eukprot:588183-Karenia_brevis.AAC.1
MRSMNVLNSKVPPCVLHSLFTLWINAWTTDRRMQKDPRPCVLSHRCSGTDDIEHYAVCKYMWASTNKKLRISMHPCSMERFMLLKPLHEDNLILLASN